MVPGMLKVRQVFFRFRGTPAAHEQLEIALDHLLGVGLQQEEPVVVSRRRLLRDVLVEMAGRNDVEHRRPGDLVGVVQRHAMDHAPAPVVADSRELVEAEVFHHLDLVLRHGALGVVGMVPAAGRLAAVAVAPQVRRHHREGLGQFRGRLRPGNVRQRVAVQEQDRGALPADHAVDRRPRGLKLESLEVIGEEIGLAAIRVRPFGPCGRRADEPWTGGGRRECRGALKNPSAVDTGFLRVLRGIGHGRGVSWGRRTLPRNGAWVLCPDGKRQPNRRAAPRPMK